PSSGAAGRECSGPTGFRENVCHSTFLRPRTGALRCSLCLALLCAIGLASAAEVLHFTFDEGSGTNAADSALSDGTPSPNDSLTLINGAHFAQGKSGTCLELSATNSPYQY